MSVQIHTAWFRKPSGETFSAEVMTFSDAGVDDIKAAFVDNPHFIGVTSPFQTIEENEEILKKVGSPIEL